MADCNHTNRHEVHTHGGDLFAELCLACDVRFFPCASCGRPRPEGKCHGLCTDCGRYTDCYEVTTCGRCEPVDRTCPQCLQPFRVPNTSRRKYCSTTCRKDRAYQRRTEAAMAES